MRIIHSEGFSVEEKKQYKIDIAINIMTAILTLLKNLTFSEEERLHSKSDLNAALQRLDAMDGQCPAEVLSRADDIELLWNSDEVQAAYSRRNQYQLVECARYFLSQVHIVMADDYVPTDQDILQTRVQTEGIIEHSFEMKSGRSRNGKRDRTLILVEPFTDTNCLIACLRFFV